MNFFFAARSRPRLSRGSEYVNTLDFTRCVHAHAYVDAAGKTSMSSDASPSSRVSTLLDEKDSKNGDDTLLRRTPNVSKASTTKIYELLKSALLATSA